MCPLAWVRLTLEMWILGVEAALVVHHRLRKISRGDRAAQVEAILMLEEKLRVAQRLYWATLTMKQKAYSDQLTKTVRTYRRKVSSNHRRLTRVV